MKLFIFDLMGTLTTLPSARVYLTLLREQNPGCKIVLWSGTNPDEIRRGCPGLLDAVDALWEKPCMLTPKLQDNGWSPDAVVIADDEPLLRRAAVRSFRNMPFLTTALEPSALGDLVRLPSE